MSNTINHNNLGDVQSHEYLSGVILAVYPEHPQIAPGKWDTADVYVVELALTWYGAPVFYHCTPSQALRPNGAIEDGARGFAVNDKAILLCRMQTAQTGKQLVSSVRVVGHLDGIRQCTYNYVVIRAALHDLAGVPLVPVDPLTNTDEMCTVFDVAAGTAAVIADPGIPGAVLTYPCPVAKIKPWLQYAAFVGVPLFEDPIPQGDDQIQIAGAVPAWTEDIQGNHIRGSAGVDAWWTTYDYWGNPVQNFFEALCFALMLDNEGSSRGTYDRVQTVLDQYAADVDMWDSRSPAFRTDSRVYPVSGAIRADGLPGLMADSRHIQTAYGEDEIWLCAVNTYGGYIVSYCDAMWKFTRTKAIPASFAIPGLIENAERLAGKAAIAQALPGGMAGGAMLGDISQVVSNQISLAGKGGEGGIWSIGTLKRINEGAFHRTIHPAMSGSVALRMTPIPEDMDQEPAHWCAINRRWDRIDAWYRYDNWQNTLPCAFGTFGVSVTWWFKSLAQRWGMESVYLDTPIGSMWVLAPDIRAAVWHMPGLSNCLFSARKDEPVNSRSLSLGKHSRNVIAQVYVAQRTSLTLWAEKEDVFVRQESGKDPYDTIPREPDGSDSIAWVKMPDGSRRHITAMTPEDMTTILSDPIIIRSEDSTDVPGSVPKNMAYRSNRNEIEILAAADIYGEMQVAYQRRHPADQKRNSALEKQIAGLISAVMAGSTGKETPFYLDMEIV